MNPPNLLELVGPEKPLHPDHERVLEHFLGKSHDEARDHYSGRGHFITENFMWMAPQGLRFYLPPFLDYLQSEDGRRDREAAYGILCSLSVQIEEHPRLPEDIVDTAKQICSYVKQHCKRFGIDPNDELYREYLKIIEGAKHNGSG